MFRVYQLVVCKNYSGYHVVDGFLKRFTGDKLRNPARGAGVQLLRTGRIHACSRTERLIGLKYLFVVVVREYVSCNKMHFVLDDKFLRNDGRFA